MVHRQSTGLTGEDVFNIKCTLRSLTDALVCAESIARTEAGKAQSKQNQTVILQGIKSGLMSVDERGDVIASRDLTTMSLYNLMRLSANVMDRYKLTQVKSLEDLETKMDKAISGLEHEIYLKQLSCNKMMEKIREAENKV